MSGSSLPEAVRARLEVRFKDRFERHAECLLHDPILDCRNSERSSLAVGFWNVDAPYRRWPVRRIPQLLSQFYDQARIDIPRRLPVGSRRFAAFVAPDLFPGVAEPERVDDVVPQLAEPLTWVVSG